MLIISVFCNFFAFIPCLSINQFPAYSPSFLSNVKDPYVSQMYNDF